MEYYIMKIEEILNKFDTTKDGIKSTTFNKRIKEYGYNKLKESKKTSKIIKFLNQFKDIMIFILLIASVVSFIMAKIQGESYIDSIAIIAIVILNAILGFLEEAKADKAIESLKNLQVSKTKVRRDGKIKIINTENIVPGDILVLEAGDVVPADARIIWENSLKVNESSLTGESLPVKKDADDILKEVPISARFNMIYTGTHIVYGKCEAVVVATGMNTEFGKIALTIDTEIKEMTPLQERVTNISKVLSVIILIVILIMFLVGLIKGMETKEIVMLSISLAVAAIPEGLPAVITIILSLGMNDLAKRKAIVRKMASVETLGSTEIICSDKTGTITQNKMTVMEVFYNEALSTVGELDKNNILFEIMALDNDATKLEDGYIGDPTEIALLECLEDIIDIERLRKNKSRIDEVPFDSDRKMMSTIHKFNDEIILYTKGSFDSIINRCNYYVKGDKVVKLTEAKKKAFMKVEKEESSKAYRMLAYAYKKLDKNYKKEKIEEDLVFAGLTAMIDPPRVDVKESIELCKKAHIRPIMITGDSLSTAVSIAKDIGIIETEEEALTGLELDNMTKAQIADAVNKYSVFARVSPMNKLDIVNALKAQDKIVAMTGDGVNDAPALKVANIGVGMGITGTEVSKGVSDIILADDSFSTIVTAVREGRRIYDNIRDVLVYLLAGNIAEILIVFIGMLLGFEIFIPIQLLYLNLVTDSLPAISLAFEEAEDDVMDRNFRSNKTFFTPFLIAKLSISAILKTIAVLTIYFVGLNLYGIEIGSTMTFLTLILLEMYYAYSCKNLKQDVLEGKVLSNKYLNTVTLFLMMVQIIVFNTPIKSLFSIESLNIIQVIYPILMVLVVFIIDEITKPLIVKLFKD